jgi:hypothetical protein
MTPTQQGYGDTSTWAGHVPYPELETAGFRKYIESAQTELSSLDFWEFMAKSGCDSELDWQINQLLSDKPVEHKLIYSQLCIAIDRLTTQKARQLEDADILKRAEDFRGNDDY